MDIKILAVITIIFRLPSLLWLLFNDSVSVIHLVAFPNNLKIRKTIVELHQRFYIRISNSAFIIN